MQRKVERVKRCLVMPRVKIPAVKSVANSKKIKSAVQAIRKETKS
jgi:hypothetical protein